MAAVIGSKRLTPNFAIPDSKSGWSKLQRSLRAESSPKSFSGKLKTAVRLLRVALGWAQHRALLQTMSGAHTCALLKTYPRAVYRYTLPYLSMGYTWMRRLEMLQGHYAFLNERLPARFFARAMERSLPVWSAHIGDMQLSIDVGGPCIQTLHREGDLSLYLEADGRPVAKASFSIVPAHTLPDLPADWNGGEHVLFVGQIQGQGGCFDAIKAVTKNCHDVSPLDMLMAALSGFSQAIGAGALVGVGQDNNISFNDDTFSLSKGYFNYSDFWERYSGQGNADGDFYVRVPFEEKPISQIKANHRGRTLQKRRFKQAIGESVKSEMQRFFVS